MSVGVQTMKWRRHVISIVLADINKSTFLYARKNFGHIVLYPLASVRPYVRPLAIWFPEHNFSSIWPTVFKLHRMIAHIG
jgi:hypothetical protein